MRSRFAACCVRTSRELPLAPKFHAAARDGFTKLSTTAIGVIARKLGDRVQLIRKGGYDWAKRYPLIAKAVLALKVQSATIDGEAVVCGRDGVSDFDWP